jgi:hypothetical protein
MTPKKVVACKLPRPQAGTLKTTLTSLVGGWAVNWQLRQLPLLPQTWYDRILRAPQARPKEML